MTWNNLQQARNNLKPPETIYNKQETTETIWNDLERARNDLKQLTMTKKRPEKQPETTYNKQETTWNDPQRVRYNLKWPKTYYNEQKNFGNTAHHDMNLFIKLFIKH